MKVLRTKVFFVLFAIWQLSVCNELRAQLPEPANPPRLLNDFVRLLPQDATPAIEQELRTIRDSTSVEIAVVIVDDLQGYDVSQFAYELGEEWGVGSKDFDNGIVILIKPKLNPNDRGQVFIATGYGLEGAVPDAVAKLIVDHEMIPRFKKEDYLGGIVAAISELGALARGEYPPDEYALKVEALRESQKVPIAPLIFLGLFFLFFVLGSVNRARHHSMRRNTSFWTALMMAGMINSSHRGSYNNFSSGSGSFGGGFGGGGFGGFGGGSFGGGGAGGSW